MIKKKTAKEKRLEKETKERLDARKIEAEEARERIREKKEEEDEEKREFLQQYRDMGDKVVEYFAKIKDWELERDLKKARFDFYRHIRINIVDKEDR